MMPLPRCTAQVHRPRPSLIASAVALNRSGRRTVCMLAESRSTVGVRSKLLSMFYCLLKMLDPYNDELER